MDKGDSNPNRNTGKLKCDKCKLWFNSVKEINGYFYCDSCKKLEAV